MPAAIIRSSALEGHAWSADDIIPSSADLHVIGRFAAGWTDAYDAVAVAMLRREDTLRTSAVLIADGAMRMIVPDHAAMAAGIITPPSGAVAEAERRLFATLGGKANAWAGRLPPPPIGADRTAAADVIAGWFKAPTGPVLQALADGYDAALGVAARGGDAVKAAVRRVPFRPGRTVIAGSPTDAADAVRRVAMAHLRATAAVHAAVCDDAPSWPDIAAMDASDRATCVAALIAVRGVPASSDGSSVAVHAGHGRPMRLVVGTDAGRVVVGRAP